MIVLTQRGSNDQIGIVTLAVIVAAIVFVVHGHGIVVCMLVNECMLHGLCFDPLPAFACAIGSIMGDWHSLFLHPIRWFVLGRHTMHYFESEALGCRFKFICSEHDEVGLPANQQDAAKCALGTDGTYIFWFVCHCGYGCGCGGGGGGRFGGWYSLSACIWNCDEVGMRLGCGEQGCCHCWTVGRWRLSKGEPGSSLSIPKDELIALWVRGVRAACLTACAYNLRGRAGQNKHTSHTSSSSLDWSTPYATV